MSARLKAAFGFSEGIAASDRLAELALVKSGNEAEFRCNKAK